MSNWSKSKALLELDRLINEIETVKQAGRGSPAHTRWWANTLRFLEDIFGQNSRYYLSISNFTWSSKIGTMLLPYPFDIDRKVAEKHSHAFIEQLNQSIGILQAAKDHLQKSNLEDVYEGKNTAPESSQIIKIINLFEHKLRKFFRNKPSNEKEVQDQVENLLIASDINYEREGPTIEYSNKKYIPDFSINKLDLIIEVKFCDSVAKSKSIIAEINDDIVAYQSKLGNLIFIIYDIGSIRDIDSYKYSFEKNENVIIKIIKH